MSSCLSRRRPITATRHLLQYRASPRVGAKTMAPNAKILTTDTWSFWIENAACRLIRLHKPLPAPSKSVMLITAVRKRLPTPTQTLRRANVRELAKLHIYNFFCSVLHSQTIVHVNFHVVFYVCVTTTVQDCFLWITES